MPTPFDFAGLGVNLVSGILAGNEARRRERAMRAAARRMYQSRNRDFNTGFALLQQDLGAFDADPARAKVRSMWSAALDQPDVIDPATLSLLKAQGMDSAARATRSGGAALREHLQRSGLSGSPAAAAIMAGQRSSIANQNQAIANELDVKARTTNRAARDKLRADYADFVASDSAQRRSISQRMVDLLASKQYGESDLLAFM